MKPKSNILFQFVDRCGAINPIILSRFKTRLISFPGALKWKSWFVQLTGINCTWECCTLTYSFSRVLYAFSQLWGWWLMRSITWNISEEAFVHSQSLSHYISRIGSSTRKQHCCPLIKQWSTKKDKYLAECKLIAHETTHSER